MRKNTGVGFGLVISVALFGCGSSNDVTAGQNGLVDGGAAQAGALGGSGRNGGGVSNAGGTGQAGTSNAGGTGQAGTSNAGGTGQAGTSNAGGTGQAGTSNAGGTGQAGTSNAGGTGQGGLSNAGGTGQGGAGGLTFGTTQCTDGKDNDGDGLKDSMDPECTGPLDNDEGTFATGIPGDNIDPKWQDCFFDGNSGGGDDGCRYSTDCLTGKLPQTSPDCTLTKQCIDFCTQFTPNGCDCFGCCQVPLAGGGTTTVQIAGTCTLADITDPQKCPPCKQSTQCNNTCGTCELCVGKDTLPPSCTPGTGGTSSTGGVSNAGGTNQGGTGNAGGTGNGGTTGTGGTNQGGTPGSGGTTGAGGSCPTPACPVGQPACGVSCLPACPTGDFCLTGCCIHSPA